MFHFVIPAFNERDNMEPLLSDLVPRARDLDARLVLVDDGSTDGTAQTAREHAGELPLTVVSHRSNLGLGAAVDSGLRAALEGADDDDGVVTLEGDNTANLDDLPALMASFAGGADLVMASFFAPGGRLLGVPRRRALASRLVSRLFQVLGGLREYHQVTPLYRVYRVSALRRVAAIEGGGRLADETGFAVNVELLLKLRRIGARVEEVPTTLDWSRRRGDSKMPLRSTVAAYLRLLATVTVARVRGSRPGVPAADRALTGEDAAGSAPV